VSRLRLRIASLCFLTVISMYMSLRSIFWNVDTYHEGDKFPGVVAAAQGLRLFTDASNQYGFVQTYLTVPLVDIFGPYLYLSRVLGFGVRVTVFLLTFLLVKDIVGKHFAWIALLLISFINPSWMILRQEYVGNGSTWPTSFGILFLLLALLFLKNGVKRHSLLTTAFAGFLSLIAWGCRLEFLTFWLVFSVSLITYRKRYSLTAPRLFQGWMLGSAIYFIGFFTILFRSQSIDAWFNQTILVWFSNPPAQPKIGIAWISMNIMNFAIIALLLPVIYFVLSSRRRVVKVIFFSILSTYITFASLISFYLIQLPSFHGVDFNAWALDIAYRSLFAPTNLLLLIALYSTFSNLRMISSKREFSEKEITQLAVMAIFVACLANLHLVYADYLYMFALPFFVTCVYFGFDKNRFNLLNDRMKHLFQFVIFFSVAVSLFMYSTKSAEVIYSYTTPSLKYLKTDNQSQQIHVDKVFLEIRNKVKPGTLRNYCINGLYSADTRGYLAADRWVWSLIPEQWLVARFDSVDRGDNLLVCAPSYRLSSMIDDLTNRGAVIRYFYHQDISLYRVVT
jgi:hypothetical protein